jgi:WD40 repeat protein
MPYCLPLRNLAFSLLTCFTLTACVAVPVPTLNDDSDKQISALRSGVTTRAEIKKTLGEPEAEIDEGRYLVYDKDWAAYGWLVIASLGGGKVWNPETEITYRIALQLSDDVVSEIRVARVDINDKINWFNKETAPPGMRTNRRVAALIAPEVPSNPLSLLNFGPDTTPPRYDRAAVSGDGSRLAARHGKIVSYLDIFDLTARTFMRRINLTKDGAPPSYTNLFEGSMPNGMAFLADNRTLLGVSHTLLWSLDTKEGLKPDKIKNLSEACSLFCPFVPMDGNLIADQNTKRFFAASGGKIWRFGEEGSYLSSLKLKTKVEPRAIDLSPNGRILTFDEGDGRVTLGDTKTAKVREFVETRTQMAAHDFAFYTSGSETHLVILRGSFAEVWRLGRTFEERLKLEHVFVLPKYPKDRFADPGRIAVSPNGRLLIVGSDRALTLWDLSTGKEIWRYMGDKLGAVKKLAFLNLGCRFISVAEKEITLWDTSDLAPSGGCRSAQ